MSDEPSDTEEDNEASLSSAVGDAANVLLLDSMSTDTDDAACFDLLTPVRPTDENILIISFTWSLDQWWERWQRCIGEDMPGNAGFILVGSEKRSTTDQTQDSTSDTSIKTVSNPENFTEIGTNVIEFLTTWEENDKKTVICLRSLTPLLIHTNLQQTYKFIYTMVGKINAYGGFAHYHFDPGTSDEQTVNTLMTLFDAVVKIDDDGTWTVRSR